MRRDLFWSLALIVLLSWNLVAFSQSSSKSAKSDDQKIAKLIKQLKRSNTDEVLSALDDLGQLEEAAAPALPTLLELLESQNPTLRAAASQTIGQLGAKGSSATDALLKHLERDDDIKVRFSAAQSLRYVADDPVKVEPYLIAALAIPDEDLQQAAAYSLVAMRLNLKPAIRAFIGLMKSKESFTRLSAASSLGNIGPDAADALPEMIALLKDEDSSVRTMTAQAIGHIVPAAKIALPALEELLHDPDADVVETAGYAIERIKAANEKAADKNADNHGAKKIIPDAGSIIIKGVLEPEAGAKLPKNLKIGIVWAYEDDCYMLTTENISASFDPETLRFEVAFDPQTPPDKELMMDYDNVTFGVGFIVAFDEDRKSAHCDDLQRVVAMSSRYAITYLSGTTPPPTNDLKTLQKLVPGYSLTIAVPAHDKDFPSFEDLVPIKSDTLIKLPLPKNPNKLKVPNWS